MSFKKINIWYLSSFLISLIVAVPIITVFSSFFETTGNYSSILKETFLYEYNHHHVSTENCLTQLIILDKNKSYKSCLIKKA